MSRSALCVGRLRRVPYAPPAADRADCGWRLVSVSIYEPIGCFFPSFAGHSGPSMGFVWLCSTARSREAMRMMALT